VKELIDHIPFLDIIFLAVFAYFIYLGWKHGMPKALMIVGAVYTGFLLSSIYYHLFAISLGRTFNLKGTFTADLLSFVILYVVISGLMAALLLGLFGHVEIKGRLAVFGRIGGSVAGAIASLIVIVVMVTLLHEPYEANKQDTDLPNQVPAIVLFNQGYDKSMLAPQVDRLAPYRIKGVQPMLPAEARVNGAPPLLQSVMHKQPTN
jgi:uncharacterized membrane protein required for colicin V production